ncbi:toll-like receptor 3 [Eucyclogobius newberryi]|uniref:toll-like receptor 3 n=1 Tax=Eucyclogobius newberryi TaxID=166745 RepID=UPI003B5AAC14
MAPVGMGLCYVLSQKDGSNGHWMMPVGMGLCYVLSQKDGASGHGRMAPVGMGLCYVLSQKDGSSGHGRMAPVGMGLCYVLSQKDGSSGHGRMMPVGMGLCYVLSQKDGSSGHGRMAPVGMGLCYVLSQKDGSSGHGRMAPVGMGLCYVLSQKDGSSGHGRMAPVGMGLCYVLSQKDDASGHGSVLRPVPEGWIQWAWVRVTPCPRRMAPVGMGLCYALSQKDGSSGHGSEMPFSNTLLPSFGQITRCLSAYVHKATATSRFPHLQWLVVLYFTLGLTECASSKKKSCVVRERHADCSHMSLGEIPQDLPRNISSLDVSHNRLVSIDHRWLQPYPGLERLDAGFNSVSKLDEKMCEAAPLLRTLNVEKNQLFEPKTQELSGCTKLERLNVASNKLKLKYEPFAGLQKLTYLDVSNNNLKSAELSMKPQLLSLEYLGLGYNDIDILKSSDFNFLKQSSRLVLNLSSVPLTRVEAGSFKNIASLRTLILDGSKIGTPVLSKICMDLSGSEIEALSLRKMKLVSLSNNTFTGLANTNLSSLDLSGNELVKIDSGSFLGLHKLKSLSMAENHFKLLKKDTFEGLESLTMLNMTRALVDSKSVSKSHIKNFAFQHLCAVETLILQGSAIGETTEHTFTGLNSLKDLDLSWTKSFSAKTITNLTFASLLASPLKKLNLRGTALKQINPGAFSCLTNLTQLHLELNFIKQTITGDEFVGLGSLEELYLFSNQITLTSTSFLFVPNLEILSLAKSLIGTTLDMEPSPFKPLSKLTVLDLSNNNMANVRGTLLEGLVNLKDLYLQHNNLARLWKSANVGGPVMFLKGAPNLLTLQLDSNGFDEIPENGLRGLFNLTQLSLSSNLLNSLKESIFDDLRSLRVFKLQKNMITAVRPQVFRTPTANLKLLVMDKNPFDCTCESIFWFVTWLNITNATVPDVVQEYICNTPLTFFNKSVLKFDTLSCKDLTPSQTLYILSSTTVLLLMIMALVVRFQGWRVQFYCNILISRTLGLSDAKAEEGRSFEFDAYVIYAEKDESWVERRMLPLEGSFKFCLEDRDSIPGMLKLESIVKNIRRSRKILYVVTNNLLIDPWCRRFTAHHALHQVIEDSRDSVVLVLVEDIHDYKLSQALFLRRGMLRPCCVVHWPPQRERVPAFHQNLLTALSKTNHWMQ